MTDTAPPLTEKDPLSEWIARIVFAFPSGDSRRDDIRALAARALALESELAQLRLEKEDAEDLLARVDKALLQGHYASAALEVREAVKAAFEKAQVRKP